MWGKRRGGSRGWAGGMALGGPPTPFLGGAVCGVHSQYPAFAPSSSEVAVGVLVFLYLVVHDLPQLCLHTVIFSSL